MSFIDSAPDLIGEPGRSYIFHLGAGIPTGTQTVSIDHNGSTAVKIATCVTLAADADTSVAASGTVEGNTADPSVALDSGSNPALRYCVIFSGLVSPARLTILSGMTAITDHDYGATCARADRQTTAGSGSFTIGYTAASDDVGMVAAAIRETSASIGITNTVAASAIGTLALALSLTLSGISPTTSVGSLVSNRALTLTGVTATGAAGAAAPNISLTLSGLTTTAAVGTTGYTVVLGTSGVVATISPGTVALSMSVPAAGVTTAGSAGSIVYSTNIPIIGVTATGTADTVTYSVGGADTFFTFGSITHFIAYPGTSVYLEAILKTSDAARPTKARLYNITDAIVVAGSTISTTSLTSARIRSGSLALNATAKEYRVEFGGETDSAPTHTIYSADLIFG